jgi:Rieske Fe-S protein
MRLPLPVVPSVESDTQSELSRRDFLSATSLALLSCLLAPACGGGGDGPVGPGGSVSPPPAGSVSFSNGLVTVKVGLVPALSAGNGHLVIAATDADRRAEVVVINLGGGVFRAFTSVCTHEGCTVSGYTNGRLVCPCHGSEYDQRGVPVAGPAPAPLREYPTTYDAPSQTLAITVR